MLKEELKPIAVQEKSKINIVVNLGYEPKTKESVAVVVEYISALKNGIEKECNCTCTLLVKMFA